MDLDHARVGPGDLLWLLISLGFRFYVTNFATTTRHMAPSAASIVLMLWFYVSASRCSSARSSTPRSSTRRRTARTPGRKRPARRRKSAGWPSARGTRQSRRHAQTGAIALANCDVDADLLPAPPAPPRPPRSTDWVVTGLVLGETALVACREAAALRHGSITARERFERSCRRSDVAARADSIPGRPPDKFVETERVPRWSRRAAGKKYRCVRDTGSGPGRMGLRCMETIFRFLFKYPPLIFQQGDLAWGVSRPVLLAVVAAAAAARRRGAADLSGRPDRASPARPGRARSACGSAPWRCCSSACSGPTLILRAAVPQQNFVGVLVDDSRSMTIADTDGQPRSAFVQEQLSRPERAAARGAVAAVRAAVLPLLVVGRPRRRRPANLKYDGTATRLGPALERARDELAGPAARRPRDGHRRRRHVRRLARRTARQPQGAIDSGVHGRPRPGALLARHPGDARRNAARRPQGHRARRRRHAVADRLQRPERDAERRGRRAHRRRRRTSRCRADGESATVRVRFTAADAGRAAVPLQDCAAGRRTGHAEQHARRAHRGARPARKRSCTSKASRGSR